MKTPISYIMYDEFMLMRCQLMVRGTRVSLDYLQANPGDAIGAMYFGDTWEDVLVAHLAIECRWEDGTCGKVARLWSDLFPDEPFPKIADVESDYAITGLYYEPDYVEAKRLLDICAKHVLDQVYEVLK